MGNYTRPNETFIVTGGDAALVAGGTFVNNQTTGASNIPNLQMGVLAADGLGSVGLNTTITAADTVADAPTIQLAVGTSHSANPANASSSYPLWPEVRMESGLIKGSGVHTATKQEAVTPTNSVWTIGNAANPIVAADNTTFGVIIAYRGRIFDEYYNTRATASYEPYIVTPDFTTLGTAEPVDYIIQNLAKEININSKAVSTTNGRGSEHVVALAIGANAAGAGTDISGLTAGDVVPVITYDSVGTRSITVDAAMIASIQAAASASSLNAAVEILEVDVSTAGTTTNGTAISLMLVGLDRVEAYDDRIPQVKTRLDIGLSKGFNYQTVHNLQGSNASEGQGQGKILDLWYRNTHGQRKYYLNQVKDPIINFPSPIDTTATYTQYTIHHGHTGQVGVGGWVSNPQLEIILVPTADTTTVASLEATLNPWITSANGVGIVTL